MCALLKSLPAALSSLLRTTKAHGVLGFGGRLALLDLRLLEGAVGFLFRDAAVVGGRLGQRCAVGIVVLHNIGIC